MPLLPLERKLIWMCCWHRAKSPQQSTLWYVSEEKVLALLTKRGWATSSKPFWRIKKFASLYEMTLPCFCCGESLAGCDDKDKLAVTLSPCCRKYFYIVFLNAHVAISSRPNICPRCRKEFNKTYRGGGGKNYHTTQHKKKIIPTGINKYNTTQHSRRKRRQRTCIQTFWRRRR